MTPSGELRAAYLPEGYAYVTTRGVMNGRALHGEAGR